jgi:hypothetical protein
MHGIGVADNILRESLAQRSLILLAASVVIGLVLNALQTPLYRVLEGYLLWPPGLVRIRRKHHLRAKAELASRIDVLPRHRIADVSLASSEKSFPIKLALRIKSFFRQDDHDRTAVQKALLRERLRRYPVDDGQVAPTRLGNAIRRLEEYGYQRYKLDSQTLWYQLSGAVPRQLQNQVETARTGVDFFVCLLYGNVLAAFIAVLAIAAPQSHDVTLLLSALVLVVASFLWYRLAVVTTDDWAAATRAMVDIGRKTLAEAVGLDVPHELDLERKMWQAYSRFVRQPFREGKSTSLDRFREVRSDTVDESPDADSPEEPPVA